MRAIYTLVLLAGFALTAQGEPLGAGLTRFQDRSPAPDFELNDIEGATHRLSDYRGKVIVINFWATWCPPCREEMPSMDRAWETLKEDGVLMLAVNVGEDEDTIFQFTASYPVRFPLLMDRDSKVVEAWPVKGLPTTFVVDPEGHLVYQAIGGRSWDDPALLDQVRSLGSEAGGAEQPSPRS